jgi:hypothetical protein
VSEWTDAQAGRAAAIVVAGLAATIAAILLLVVAYALTWGYALHL